MYGGPSTSFWRYEPLKNDATIFDPFSPFSYTGGLYLFVKIKKIEFFDIQCVVEASSFRLNHNLILENKENYPRHTKTVQNSLGFMPEVKPLHKPRGDLVLCALISTLRPHYRLIGAPYCKFWDLRFISEVHSQRSKVNRLSVLEVEQMSCYAICRGGDSRAMWRNSVTQLFSFIGSNSWLYIHSKNKKKSSTGALPLGERAGFTCAPIMLVYEYSITK